MAALRIASKKTKTTKTPKIEDGSVKPLMTVAV